MIFARRLGSTNVTSLQERQSRFVMLISNDDKRASTITKGIDAQLAPLPLSGALGVKRKVFDPLPRKESWSGTELGCGYLGPHGFGVDTSLLKFPEQYGRRSTG